MGGATRCLGAWSCGDGFSLALGFLPAGFEGFLSNMCCAAVVLNVRQSGVCHRACQGTYERTGTEGICVEGRHSGSVLAVVLQALNPTVAVEKLRPVAIRTASPHGESVEARRPAQGFQIATDHTWLISVDAARRWRKRPLIPRHHWRLGVMRRHQRVMRAALSPARPPQPPRPPPSEESLSLRNNPRSSQDPGLLSCCSQHPAILGIQLQLQRPILQQQHRLSTLIQSIHPPPHLQPCPRLRTPSYPSVSPRL